MSQQTAKLSYLRIAPRKVRLLANSLKGLSVNEAEAALLLRPKRAAKPLLKLLRSAVSNAKNNQKLNADNLVIEGIFVNQGPMLKRHLPRARGMATPIQKKMSHVTLVIAESPSVKSDKFKIIVEKKLKDKSLDKKASRAKEKEPREERSAGKEQEAPGIFKRMFRRKAV